MFILFILWELDYREGWAPKNWCFQTVVLEKTLESPLDCKEIQPVHPKGNQPWIFIGRPDTETEVSILWPRDAKSQFIGKDLDSGKDWGQEEKGVAYDETVGWNHWLNRQRVWANSGRWWRTGKPGVLWFMGSQRVRHNLVTEQQQMGHSGKTEECLVLCCQIGSNPCGKGFFFFLFLFFNCICLWSQILFGNRHRRYVQ